MTRTPKTFIYGIFERARKKYDSRAQLEYDSMLGRIAQLAYNQYRDEDCIACIIHYPPGSS